MKQINKIKGNPRENNQKKKNYVVLKSDLKPILHISQIRNNNKSNNNDLEKLPKKKKNLEAVKIKIQTNQT